MAKLSIVMGAPATGKSHFIERHFAGQPAVRLNVYDYQQRLIAEGTLQGIELLAHANELIAEDAVANLSAGRDVVMEHTYYRAKRRIALTDAVRRIPGVVIEIYVMQPTEALWTRYLAARALDAARAHDEAKIIEFPNPAEGYHAIYTFDGRTLRLHMDPPDEAAVEAARTELREENAKNVEQMHRRQARQSLLSSMERRKFWHYCEVCGRREQLTAKEAHAAGWDYPPNIGYFGLLGPRTCPDCALTDTLYWKVSQQSVPLVVESTLSPKELVTWRRIRREPESLLTEEPDEQ